MREARCAKLELLSHRDFPVDDLRRELGLTAPLFEAVLDRASGDSLPLADDRRLDMKSGFYGTGNDGTGQSIFQFVHRHEFAVCVRSIIDGSGAPARSPGHCHAHRSAVVSFQGRSHCREETMKKSLVALCSCCLCCLTVLLLTVSTADARRGSGNSGGGGGTVCICHRPPGNPENAHTICIGAPAVRAHLRHGDTEGECPVTCDSGDDCRTDQFCKRADGVCAEDASGICTNRPATCPTTIAPVCGCDGTTYDNACEANAAGVTVASAGECPGGGACGGAAGDTCADDEFCKLDEGACSEEAEGVCTVIPGVCHPDFNPVCGCDGVTYSNECFAASAGASVAATGACAEGAACGGTGGATCGDGEFCLPALGDCAADAAGTCRTIPGVCPQTFLPVCGCDGITYSNVCSAASAGVGINHTGECEADQQVCGGTGGATCPTGEVCLRPDGECAADAEGVCQPTPVICSANVDPVCGCDGITYSNACVAAGAGVTVASEGECQPPEVPVACDGASGGTCAEGEFCLHADGACATDADGTCTALPLVCQPIVLEVCGCDGSTYPSACFANGNSVNVDHTGACTP
jgi:hypothetical protein